MTSTHVRMYGRRVRGEDVEVGMYFLGDVVRKVIEIKPGTEKENRIWVLLDSAGETTEFHSTTTTQAHIATTALFAENNTPDRRNWYEYDENNVPFGARWAVIP